MENTEKVEWKIRTDQNEKIEVADITAGGVARFCGGVDLLKLFD
jgi:hypothetical protein